ncbi:MAG: PHP domain-containing protein [Thermodesulfobacteriota bacterium]|nr:PHP domain-containing protein [Thermodesulfobacteriota bacterium]
MSKTIIDLHVHTKKLSPCSEMTPEEAAVQAKEMGLHGICFAEHNKPWDTYELSTIQERHKIKIFQGIEVDTTEGHVVVFGLQRHFQGITPIEDLRRMADEEGGFMIAAHPFRGFLIFGFSKLRMNADDALKNPLFQFVDAMETFSGRQTTKENDFSSQVCERLNLKSVGGSDAHSTKDIGKCVTIFENSIESQDDLLKELKEGNFAAGYFQDV